VPYQPGANQHAGNDLSTPVPKARIAPQGTTGPQDGHDGCQGGNSSGYAHAWPVMRADSFNSKKSPIPVRAATTPGKSTH